MRLLAIYDNGGKTIDRYTVITDRVDHSGQYHDALGMSANPSDPLGYSQWGTVLKSINHYNFNNKQWRTRCGFGRRISFESLPAQLQEHIATRLWSE